MIKQFAIACVCALTFINVVFSWQELQLPTTNAGKRTSAFLKAYNSGDEAKMSEFIRDNISATALERRPLEERIKSFHQLRSEFGNMRPTRIQTASESQVVLQIQAEKGVSLELGLDFEPNSPNKILSTKIQVFAGPEGNDEPAGNVGALISESECVGMAEKNIEELVKADDFSGIVMIARDGKPLFHKAYGLASQEFKVPNQLNTKFNLGSINKTFTQVAIAQLVAKGLLAYDDKLGKHLPQYPNKEAAEKVTIRQMLSMSSGIGDFFGTQFESMSKDKLRTIADYLPLFANEPLLFEPGSRQQYSNGGYVVLGAIIEQVSGQDYFAYVRENIYRPSGMLDSDWYEADKPTPNLASGYTREGDSGIRVNNIYTRPARGSSAGGGYSTAPDLLKFAVALQAGKLPANDFRSNPGKVEKFGGLGIAGGSPGVNAVLEVGPPNGYTLIVLSNYDPPSAEKVAKQIRGLLQRIKK